MAIEPKELMQVPRFEGIGKFLYSRPGNGEWKPSFAVEFFGGQVSIEVDESELQNEPAVESMFLISGRLRYNTRNASVSLVTSEKKFLSATPETLTQEYMERYVRGLRVWGVGIVHSKSSSVVNRVTYNKATLKWQGATHEFRSLPPEMYQRIPSMGKYVRFELGLSVREERNQSGQQVLIHYPSLALIQMDELVTGSVPSANAANAVKPPVPPAKV